MRTLRGRFRQVWCVDFEFRQLGSNLPEPICMVAKELWTQVTLRRDLRAGSAKPPILWDKDVLFVAYYASAEMSCHLALNWPMPSYLLDLYSEFRERMNGSPAAQRYGLLDALAHFGIAGISPEAKEQMRHLAMADRPLDHLEFKGLLDYCESDVVSLERLLEGMIAELDVERALLRGHYVKSVARIERNGVPVDADALIQVRGRSKALQASLVAQVGEFSDLFRSLTFSEERFRSLLVTKGVDWPLLSSGRLCLRDEVFKEQADLHPWIGELRQLRKSLVQLRDNPLEAGPDGRVRCLMSPYGSKTSRNQPRGSIFGLAKWFRGLIRPEPQRALVYVDWAQQEFGIAAALSRDGNMLGAYSSGDPYLAFAKQAGAVPEDATKESHPTERNLFKACALAVQYGMGERTLALKLGKSESFARQLLQLHRKTYPQFWRWSDAAVESAMLTNSISSVYGWRLRVTSETRPTTLRNYLMQANGAEMLRLATCFAHDAAVQICSLVHDAVLTECSASDLDEETERVRDAMGRASAILLSGLRLQTDVKVIRYPDRFLAPEWQPLWEKVSSFLSSSSDLATGEQGVG